MPAFNNAVYVKISQGSHIGHLDIYGSQSNDQNNTLPKADFREQKLKDQHYNYQFTSQALSICDLLSLSIDYID